MECIGAGKVFQSPLPRANPNRPVPRARAGHPFHACRDATIRPWTGPLPSSRLSAIRRARTMKCAAALDPQDSIVGRSNTSSRRSSSGSPQGKRDMGRHRLSAITAGHQPGGRPQRGESSGTAAPPAEVAGPRQLIDDLHRYIYLSPGIDLRQTAVAGAPLVRRPLRLWSNADVGAADTI